MEETANLKLPYIMPAQAQKHVTHNEAIRMLDALVQLCVLGRNRTEPPGEPAEGDRHIVAAGATGAWEGQDGRVAAWQDGGWLFHEPLEGWLAWAADEAALLFYSGSAWTNVGEVIAALQNLALLGVGTTADAENPFAAKLNKALWTAKYMGEGGDGDLRYTMNKEAPARTLSLLMQSDWSGRAEIGLVGNDDLSVKVSPDGGDWKEALVVDGGTGAARFPHGVAHAASGAPLAGLMFTPGGMGINSIWRIDVEHTQNPRTATVASISGDAITIAGDARQFGRWATHMAGVSYARIWNTTRDPIESAWLRAGPGTSASSVLWVKDAADIAAWSNGDTIQFGDPETVTPGRVVALDISPMLQNLFGTAFRQSGIVVNCGFQAATQGDSLAISPSGVDGSFIAAARYQDTNGVTIIPCTELSPISNSNLVLFRESLAGTATVSLLNSQAILV